MAYRDDLEAALARIDALERELSEARDAAAGRASEALGEARRTIADLEAKLADATAAAERAAERHDRTRKLREERDHLRAERDQLAEKLRAADESRRRKPDRPRAEDYAPRPLFEHNRSRAPIDGGAGAGVLCPECLGAGLRVEMRRDLGFAVLTAQERDLHLTNVACPRCLFTGLLRR